MSDGIAFRGGRTRAAGMVEQATVARITAGSGESAPVRESDPFREAGRATQTWAGSSDAPAVPHLLGEAGHQVLGEQKAVLKSDRTSSPSRPTSAVPTSAVPTPVRSSTASSRAVR
ncbi:hypothetical protein [Streptomyces sviceus]|uniref:hypothetical protein n=1 Tax=Streptomyces sviceus TaxID=285530 RepID=UPI00331B7F30